MQGVLRDGNVCLWQGDIDYAPGVEILSWPLVRVGHMLCTIRAKRLVYATRGRIQIWWDKDGAHDRYYEKQKEDKKR